MSPPKDTKGEDGRAPDPAPPTISRRGVPLLPTLELTAQRLTSNFHQIPDSRKKQLEGLGLFIRARLSTGDAAEVLFLCPRHPQLSQQAKAWSTAASAYYGVRGIRFRAVGPESSSSWDPEVTSALERSGFQILGQPVENRLIFSKQAKGLDLLILRPDDPKLPRSEFAAVAICSTPSTTASPTRNAALTVSLPYDYDDPPASLNGSESSDAGRETNARIGTEMFYLASLVARTR